MVEKHPEKDWGERDLVLALNYVDCGFVLLHNVRVMAHTKAMQTMSQM